MNLGDVVRDKISGFSGVATCRLDYFNGCVRWQVTPRVLHEGKPVEAQYFDDEQLALVEGGERVHLTRRLTGGDRPAPAGRSNPSR